MTGVIIRNCPHCPAEHSAFRLTWSARHSGVSKAECCVAVCGACGGPIAFVAFEHTGGSNPAQHNGNIEPHWRVSTIWPTREAPAAPAHTPPSVKARFEDGEDAFSRLRWNSAVAMYRSALDIATKGMEGVPSGETFFARLKWLHDNHAITPDIHEWATKVRVEGNAALHDPEQFSEDDAKALRFFTEMFLRYVFELPGAVRHFRGQSKSATPPMDGKK